MIRACPGTADYINHGLCTRDPANNQIVLPNNGWILCWTIGNNIKERLDDYYRQNPVPATVVSAAIPLAPTTGIKDVPLHMSQNLLEVVKNLHAAISADPDNTDDDEAIIQTFQQAQQALEQKIKRWVRFDGVEMPARKGKAPESILKHLDHAGAVRETHNSTAGPTTPLETIVTAPSVTSPTVKIPPPPTPLNPSTATPPPLKTLLSSAKLSTAPWTSPSPSPSVSSFPSLWKHGSSTRNSPQCDEFLQGQQRLVNWKKSLTTAQQYTAGAPYTTLTAPMTSE
jgi:hypothetical protein